MKCQVRRAEITTLLAIPVGAYTFGKECGSEAVTIVTPKPGSRFNKVEMAMCQPCLEECCHEVGVETINTTPIRKP